NNLWPSAATGEHNRFNQYGIERHFAAVLEIAGKFRLKDYIRETAMDVLTNAILLSTGSSQGVIRHIPFYLIPIAQFNNRVTMSVFRYNPRDYFYTSPMERFIVNLLDNTFDDRYRPLQSVAPYWLNQPVLNECNIGNALGEVNKHLLFLDLKLSYIDFN
ncbi:unnamed protein product, partial [Brugia pahangi]|uniref:Exostosin domain-containing protein n=1 Tax=Brugia pahangi TaxID=6280 RepID=A0A0N4TA26_BRUPA